jgi:hypothetical protein
MDMMNFQSKILKSLYKHQLIIKTFHFQTLNYGAHKSADCYLEKFTSNLDRFMESAQGRFGRVNLNELNIRLSTVNDETIVESLDKFDDFLNNLESSINLTKDLSAIRDEMMADLQQFKYLLTFK